METSTTSSTYNQEKGVVVRMADKVDVRRAFEAIAKIIGDREHVQITVEEIIPKEGKTTTKVDTA